MDSNKTAKEANTNDLVNRKTHDIQILSETALRRLSKTFASMIPKESRALSDHDMA